MTDDVGAPDGTIGSALSKSGAVGVLFLLLYAVMATPPTFDGGVMAIGLGVILTLVCLSPFILLRRLRSPRQ